MCGRRHAVFYLLVLVLPHADFLEAAAVGVVDTAARMLEGGAVVLQIGGRYVLAGLGLVAEAEHALGGAPGVAVGAEAAAHAVVGVGGGVLHVAARLVEAVVEHEAVVLFSRGHILDGRVGELSYLCGRENLVPDAQFVEDAAHGASGLSHHEVGQFGQALDGNVHAVVLLAVDIEDDGAGLIGDGVVVPLLRRDGAGE